VAIGSSRGDLGTNISSVAIGSSRGDLGTNISSVAIGSSSRGDLGTNISSLEREPQWSFEECRGGAHGDIAFRAWLRQPPAKLRT
jgi:hypothetical protein